MFQKIQGGLNLEKKPFYKNENENENSFVMLNYLKLNT